MSYSGSFHRGKLLGLDPNSHLSVYQKLAYKKWLSSFLFPHFVCQWEITWSRVQSSITPNVNVYKWSGTSTKTGGRYKAIHNIELDLTYEYHLSLILFLYFYFPFESLLNLWIKEICNCDFTEAWVPSNYLFDPCLSQKDKRKEW